MRVAPSALRVMLTSRVPLGDSTLPVHFPVMSAANMVADRAIVPSSVNSFVILMVLPLAIPVWLPSIHVAGTDILTARMRVICLIALLGAGLAAQDGWKPLFNGKDLAGWEIKGDGKWTVLADGTLLGRAVSGEKNPFGTAWPVALTEKQYLDWRQTQSWLYTLAEFGEFDLHVEYMTPAGGNSGISIRDHTRGKFAIGPSPDYTKTPGHQGYEIQIVNGVKTKYPSGSVYLFAPATFGFEKESDWNSLDIASRNDVIRVSLNGREAASFGGDPERPKTGPIGLQLHDRFNMIMFRNIRIREVRR